MLKVTNEIREAARQLLLARHNADDAARLEAVANGQRKLIRAEWWRKFYAAIDRARLAKIAAMADPARNDKEHERAAAARKLATAKARRPPGMPPEAPPLPTGSAEWTRPRKGKARSSSLRTLQKLSDSVATPVEPTPASDSVARLEALNKERSAKRAAQRASLKCQSCGKPLAAQRATLPRQILLTSASCPMKASLGICRFFRKSFQSAVRDDPRDLTNNMPILLPF
jgi:hypothetical protein